MKLIEKAFRECVHTKALKMHRYGRTVETITQLWLRLKKPLALVKILKNLFFA